MKKEVSNLIGRQLGHKPWQVRPARFFMSLLSPPIMKKESAILLRKYEVAKKLIFC